MTAILILLLINIIACFCLPFVLNTRKGWPAIMSYTLVSMTAVLAVAFLALYGRVM
jgi:hypothetical protein